MTKKIRRVLPKANVLPSVVDFLFTKREPRRERERIYKLHMVQQDERGLRRHEGQRISEGEAMLHESHGGGDE